MSKSLLLGAVCPALLALPGFRNFLEASMYTHMLILYPALIASGFLLGQAAATRRIAQCYAGIDAHGLLTVATVTVLGAFWMVPAAIDFAVIDSIMWIARTASLLAVGLVPAWRYQSLSDVTLLFLAGNSAWMLLTAGALIGTTETRLCVSDLFEDQRVTGAGLGLYGCLVGGLAIARAVAPRSSAAGDPLEREGQS